jgi:hypothetical protein
LAAPAQAGRPVLLRLLPDSVFSLHQDILAEKEERFAFVANAIFW